MPRPRPGAQAAEATAPSEAGREKRAPAGRGAAPVTPAKPWRIPGRLREAHHGPAVRPAELEPAGCGNRRGTVDRWFHTWTISDLVARPRRTRRGFSRTRHFVFQDLSIPNDDRPGYHWSMVEHFRDSPYGNPGPNRLEIGAGRGSERLPQALSVRPSRWRTH